MEQIASAEQSIKRTGARCARSQVNSIVNPSPFTPAVAAPGRGPARDAGAACRAAALPRHAVNGILARPLRPAAASCVGPSSPVLLLLRLFAAGLTTLADARI